MEGPPKRSNEAENDYGTTKPWDPLALIAQVQTIAHSPETLARIKPETLTRIKYDAPK